MSRTDALSYVAVMVFSIFVFYIRYRKQKFALIRVIRREGGLFVVGAAGELHGSSDNEILA